MPVDTSPRPSGAHRPNNSSGGGVSKALIALIAALLVAALVVLGIWAFGKKDGEDEPADDQSSSSSSGDESAAPAKTPKGLPKDASGITIGKAGGPELAVFEDFQCPGCKGFEDMLGEGISQRVDEGKLQVTYHLKTFLDRMPGEHSVRAASAAYCASDAGKFREYHDTVFKNQPENEGDGWTDDDLKRFGKDAGIEGDALKTFEKCVDDKTYTDYALKGEQYSNELGVTGTPTLYLNGELFDLQQLKSKEEFFAKLDEAGAPKKSDASATK